MRAGILLSVIMLAGCLNAGSGGSGGAGSSKGRLLIIGMDGTRIEGVEQSLTPNFDALVASGLLDNQAITGDVSLSGPGWASMLTGVWCDKHRVLDNDATWAMSNFADYPHFMRRLEDQRPEAVTVSISHWAPINEEIACAGSAPCPLDHVLTVDSDAAVRDSAVQMLSEMNPDAMFLQFDDIDHAGHGDPETFDPGGFCPYADGDVAFEGQTGVCTALSYNPNYVETIETTDAYIGDVMAALKARPNFSAENWLVIVAPDHGGAGVVLNQHGFPHAQDRRTFLVLNGHGLQSLPAARTRIVDVAVTALSHLGVEVSPDWQLDGQPVGVVAPDQYVAQDIPECADQIGVFGDAR